VLVNVQTLLRRCGTALNCGRCRNANQQMILRSGLTARNPPLELFIHATSSFTDEEWKGFLAGSDPKTNLVGFQITDAHDDLKLFRPGSYPVIRGSALVIGDRSAYLWTAGYAARLDTYMGPETPNPLLIRVIRGDCPLKTVLQDILGLTKINFNSCLHNDRLPVTIHFANAVGDVLVSPLETCSRRTSTRRQEPRPLNSRAPAEDRLISKM